MVAWQSMYNSWFSQVKVNKCWLPKCKWIWKKAELQSITVKYVSGGFEGKIILTRATAGMSLLSVSPSRKVLFLLFLLVSNGVVQGWGNVWMCQYVLGGFSFNDLINTGRISGP